MPATWSAQQCFIRITLNDDTKVIDFFKDFKKIHIHQHNDEPENIHYHIAIEYNDSITKQTISNRIVKFFDVAKTKFSVKPWDGEDKAIAYMLRKGRTVFTTYNDEQINEIKKICEEYKENQNKAKQRKQLKPNHWDVIELIRQKVINKNNEDTWNIMIKELEANKIRTSIFDLERWFVTVKRSDEDFSKDLRHAILNRLYR